MEIKDAGSVSSVGVTESLRWKNTEISNHDRWWMGGFRCESTKHNSIMSCGWCVVQHYWRNINSKPMEHVRKFVYDQISDKQDLLEVTTVWYENERRYEDSRSFGWF